MQNTLPRVKFQSKSSTFGNSHDSVEVGFTLIYILGLQKKNFTFFIVLLGHLRNGFPLRHKDFRTTINPKTVWEGDFFVKALCPDLDVAKANSGWAEKLPKCPKMSKAVPEKCGKSKQKWRYKVMETQTKLHSCSALGVLSLALHIQILPEKVFWVIFWFSKYLLSRCLDV